MSARSRKPTDQVPTQIHDSRPPSRPVKPTRKGVPSGQAVEDDPTLVDSQPGAATAATTAPKASASQPMRVISMKTPADLDRDKQALNLVEGNGPGRVQIRDIGEVRKRHATPPQGLGNLAPPRDEKRARARLRDDFLLWGSIIIIVGSFVTLGIWFIAR